MTLIIGVRCSDGVVIGADGAATLGSTLGGPTVMQPVTKLQILEGTIVMGVSGQVGLSQLYCDRVGSLWRDRKLSRGVRLPEVQRLIQQAILVDAKEAMAAAETTVPFTGPQQAFMLAATASLIAVPVGGLNGTPELIQCNHVGMTEAATTDLPFVAIGSGQELADPFLAILRRIFWPDRLPRVSDGVFAIIWSLLHAIKTSTGGVSEPIQIAVLQGKELSARILEDSELQEHRQHVLEAEQHLATFGIDSERETEPPPTLSQTDG